MPVYSRSLLYAPNQCKPRGGRVRAGGGDLTTKSIPRLGHFTNIPSPWSGNLINSDQVTQFQLGFYIRRIETSFGFADVRSTMRSDSRCGRLWLCHRLCLLRHVFKRWKVSGIQCIFAFLHHAKPKDFQISKSAYNYTQIWKLIMIYRSEKYVNIYANVVYVCICYTKY